jgi:hypothetical protein
MPILRRFTMLNRNPVYYPFFALLYDLDSSRRRSALLTRYCTRMRSFRPYTPGLRVSDRREAVRPPA